MLRSSHRLTALALVAVVPFAVSCTSNDTSGSADDARTITVNASDEGCEVSRTEVPAGSLEFEVTNTGSQVNEFYLLAEDGRRIVAEVENVGPDSTRKLTINAVEGSYFTACKPGMEGDGIRDDFTVTAPDDEAEVTGGEQ